MPTLDEITRSVEEASGAAVLARLANPDPHEGDLPIRHHVTGQIVAYVPKEQADGAKPVVYNGLVVGYYRDSENGRSCPMFSGGRCTWWYCGDGEEWMGLFSEDGKSKGGVLLRRTR